MVTLADGLVDELAAVTPTRPAVRAAQLATVVRFVSELHTTPGRAVLDAEVARASLAHRIRADVAALYGSTTQVVEHRRESDIEAAWRGAVLVGGKLADPRRATLTITCPT